MCTQRVFFSFGLQPSAYFPIDFQSLLVRSPGKLELTATWASGFTEITLQEYIQTGQLCNPLLGVELQTFFARFPKKTA